MCFALAPFQIPDVIRNVDNDWRERIPDTRLEKRTLKRLAAYRKGADERGVDVSIVFLGVPPGAFFS